MDETDPFVIRLATNLHTAFRLPWWQFWRRHPTQREVEDAIVAALTGKVKPIRHYGIAVPVNATRVGIFNRIMEQTARMRSKR